ncbi:hypothetical protein ABZ815_01405 [Nonomuraea sp. NPDC047529]|uniref:hypothetical protein n=1 Tax=Nonomuraea sp. NPDC047529 TaxID=3155623 RepID=UPI00340B4167
MNFSKNTSVKVGLLIAGGIVVNKLSEFVDASAPIILIGSFVVLVGMLVYEQHSESAADDPQAANLVKFGLASILLGAAIGGLSMLPLLPNREYSAPWIDEGTTFHGYELLSVGIVSLLSSIAAFRRRPVLQLTTFLVTACTGMTLAIVSLGTDHIFSITFVGWTAAAAAVTAIVYWARDVIKLYREFWGAGDSLASQNETADH